MVSGSGEASRASKQPNLNGEDKRYETRRKKKKKKKKCRGNHHEKKAVAGEKRKAGQNRTAAA